MFLKGFWQEDKINIGLLLDGSAVSPDLYIGTTLACLNFDGNKFLSMHRLYKYVNVSTIMGQASFRIRLSKPSKSRVHDCLSAQRLFETSKVVTGPNIKEDLKPFHSIYFFRWPKSFSLDLSFSIIFSEIVEKWLFKFLGEMLVIRWDFDTCFLVYRFIAFQTCLESLHETTSFFFFFFFF